MRASLARSIGIVTGLLGAVLAIIVIIFGQVPLGIALLATSSSAVLVNWLTGQRLRDPQFRIGLRSRIIIVVGVLIGTVGAFLIFAFGRE